MMPAWTIQHLRDLEQELRTGAEARRRRRSASGRSTAEAPPAVIEIPAAEPAGQAGLERPLARTG